MPELLELTQNETQLIVFKLGNEEYAIPITCIQEIIMLQTPTKIPRSPSFVEGIINLRGHIIPIIDGKKKFQIDSKNSTKNNDNRIIVVEIEGETIGLIVDAVSEVVHLKRDDIEVPPLDVKSDNEIVWGIGKFKDRLLILLNPQKFLSLGEASKLIDLSRIAENLKNSETMVQMKTA